MVFSYESNIRMYTLFRIFASLDLTIAIYVLFFLSTGLSMTQIMVLETILVLLVLVLEVPSGAFADLYGRKLSLSLGIFFMIASFVIFGLATTFLHFIFAEICTALSWVFFSGADSALVYDSLKELKREKDYVKIYGRVNFLSLAILATCGLFAGFFLHFFNYRELFFITAGLCVFGLFATLALKEPPIHQKQNNVHYFEHLKQAVKFAYNHKIVWNLIIYYGLFAALGHLTGLLIQPIYGASEFPKYLIGIAVFLYMITFGLGNYLAEKFVYMFNEQKLLFGILLIASLSFISIFFVSPFAGIILISIMSFVCGVRDLVVSKGIHEHVSSHQRATIISIQGMSKSLMYVIFAPIIGFMTDTYTPQAAFLAMGIGLFIFFIYYFLMGLSRREKNEAVL